MRGRRGGSEGEMVRGDGEGGEGGAVRGRQ